VDNLDLSQECLGSQEARVALQSLAKTNPALHLELSLPREGPAKDPKANSTSTSGKKNAARSSTRRGNGGKSTTSLKRWKRDEDSELDTDSGSGSEDDNNNSLDFDALDSNDSDDIAKSDYENEDDHEHNHGDNEDVSAEDIIQVMMSGSTTGLNVRMRGDGSLFHPMSGEAQGDTQEEEVPEDLGRGKRKRKLVNKAYGLHYWE
jgi:hypothetical protein